MPGEEEELQCDICDDTYSKDEETQTCPGCGIGKLVEK